MNQVSIRWCHHIGDNFDFNVERMDISYNYTSYRNQNDYWRCCSINDKLDSRKNTRIDARSKKNFPCSYCPVKKCKIKTLDLKSKPILLFSEIEI